AARLVERDHDLLERDAGHPQRNPRTKRPGRIILVANDQCQRHRSALLVPASEVRGSSRQPPDTNFGSCGRCRNFKSAALVPAIAGVEAPRKTRSTHGLREVEWRHAAGSLGPPSHGLGYVIAGGQELSLAPRS